MTDDEKQQWVAEQIAKVRKIYIRMKPRLRRRGKRFDKMLPIRKVIARYIFIRHEQYLEHLFLFTDLGFMKNARLVKNYKQWASKKKSKHG